MVTPTELRGPRPGEGKTKHVRTYFDIEHVDATPFPKPDELEMIRRIAKTKHKIIILEEG